MHWAHQYINKFILFTIVIYYMLFGHEHFDNPARSFKNK